MSTSSRNQAPIAFDDVFSVTESINLSGAPDPFFIRVPFEINDVDLDGTLDLDGVQITQMPTLGNVLSSETLGLGNIAPGLIYFPFRGNEGKVDSFKYRVPDNDGALSNEATVTIYNQFGIPFRSGDGNNSLFKFDNSGFSLDPRLPTSLKLTVQGGDAGFANGLGFVDAAGNETILFEGGTPIAPGTTVELPFAFNDLQSLNPAGNLTFFGLQNGDPDARLPFAQQAQAELLNETTLRYGLEDLFPNPADNPGGLVTDADFNDLIIDIAFTPTVGLSRGEVNFASAHSVQLVLTSDPADSAYANGLGFTAFELVDVMLALPFRSEVVFDSDEGLAPGTTFDLGVFEANQWLMLYGIQNGEGIFPDGTVSPDRQLGGPDQLVGELVSPTQADFAIEDLFADPADNPFGFERDGDFDDLTFSLIFTPVDPTTATGDAVTSLIDDSSAVI